MEFFFDNEKYPFGYSWIFPRNNETNVGVVTTAKNRKEILDKFLKERNISGKIIKKIGGSIPKNGVVKQLATQKIALIGDTGGFTPEVIAIKTDWNGFIYGFSQPVNSSMSPYTIEISELSSVGRIKNPETYIRNCTVLLLKTKIISLPYLSSIPLFSISVDGFILYTYLLGVLWLTFKLKPIDIKYLSFCK